jgi:hypothetical protein
MTMINTTLSKNQSALIEQDPGPDSESASRKDRSIASTIGSLTPTYNGVETTEPDGRAE